MSEKEIREYYAIDVQIRHVKKIRILGFVDRKLDRHVFIGDAREVEILFKAVEALFASRGKGFVEEKRRR